MARLREIGRKVRTKVGLVIGAVVIAGSSAAVAVAAIPDEGGVIHSCYSKLNGSVRIIDSANATCRITENSLNWNQQGQSGGGSGASVGFYFTLPQSQTRTFQLPNVGEITLKCGDPATTTYAAIMYKNTTSSVIYNGVTILNPGDIAELRAGGSNGGATYAGVIAGEETQNAHAVRVEINGRPFETEANPGVRDCRYSYSQLKLQ